MQEIFKAHELDARKLKSVIKDKIVDVTITSPPYFDLKDYGSKNQIGFGQEYHQYLDELKDVFKSVYDITKDSGTLWVVIDTFKRDGVLVPLPFDFADKVKEVGWKLQEVIIWGKDRTLPWTHKGQMRKLFEYILVFSKNNDYNFFIDEVRDFQSLKKWWIKYPERYNPKGKTPEAIWNFNIPVQGSWGNGQVNHFCPLPGEMIEQILKLTTKENDIVLDCFSGSGAVLSKADNMKRNYVGFDLNKDYIKAFNKSMKNNGKQKRKEYEIEKKGSMNQKKFEKLILELRSLKYGRIMYKNLKALKLDGIERVYIQKSKTTPKKENALICVDYYILLDTSKQKKQIEETLKDIIKKPPLSKFGVEPNFFITENINDFLLKIKQKTTYSYSEKATHKYLTKIKKTEILNSPKASTIFSNMGINLNESDYDI